MSKNKKISLMIKFILPFAVFLTIMYLYYLFIGIFILILFLVLKLLKQ